MLLSLLVFKVYPGRQEVAAAWMVRRDWASLSLFPFTRHLEPLGELSHANVPLSPCRLVTAADKEH